MRRYGLPLWERRGPLARLLAALLAPAEWVYAAGVALRGWAYDSGLFRSIRPAVPTLSVGNLAVGGTGKTPLAAWLASALLERGRRPAIVMRGYGGDEPLVHRALNPSIPVLVSPDRVRGVAAAAAAGCDVVVLDDALQHRRIRPHESLAIVAAEDWGGGRRHLLPRGPWREGPGALQRATLVVVSRKSATVERAAEVADDVKGLAPQLPLARVHLALSKLVRYDGAESGLGAAVPLEGFHATIAVAGVARPDSFFAQIEAAGVTTDERRAFPDHHRYGRDEVEALNRAAAEGPILATLKDAVKLHPLLAPGVELFVPLQEPEWEAGTREVERMIERTDASAPRGNGSS